MKKYIFLFLIIPIFLSAKIYKGAEYRTKNLFKYGRFEVNMKSAYRDGMLASFFTYNDDFPNSAWNEIDIEIMGRYSDDIQFNPLTPGQISHTSHHQAKFNPATDFHTYAFEWTPNYVAWFVDGVETHRQTGAHIKALNISQKIMMNIWNPQFPNWAGEWNENILPAFAFYDWVSYSSFTPGAGSSGTGNNFTFQWKDNFDSWDQTRWDKATHTFGGNGSDFIQDNAVLKDGKLILCLTKEDAIGFTDKTPPSINFGRAEVDGIKIKFTEEVDPVSVENISNYIISGMTISTAKLLADSQTVFLTVANYDTATISNIIVMNVKDRFQNSLIVKNVLLAKSKPISFPIKINCGGTAYNDYLADQEWGPKTEFGYLDGSTRFNNVNFSGTTEHGVYQYERNGLVRYRFRVPNGKYNVQLMMAETYFSNVGDRIFSIAVEGNIIEKYLDIFAKVGKFAAYKKNVTNVSVEDGMLEIHFIQQKNPATISGIIISSVSAKINDKYKTQPTQFNIGQNYPNPFNGETLIPVEISKSENLTIKFFDTMGRKISEMPIGLVDEGKHLFSWNAKDFTGNKIASGVYYYVVEGEVNSLSKKLILIQ